nr:uncharacterized protein LOC123751303 [Procambarus clarkii]
MPGIQLLLGNDLVNHQDSTNLIICDKPQACDSTTEKDPAMTFEADEEREAMFTEVKYILNNGLATPCESPWASHAYCFPNHMAWYERLPFGLYNAPATFHRSVNLVIQDLDDTYAYLDDIVVATNSWEEHHD